MPSTFPCPQCGEYNYHKSHSKNIFERAKKVLLKQRIYRCHRCGYREWERRIAISKGLTLQRFLFYIGVIIIASFIGMLCEFFLM